jgi:exodeoxyribonuclease III
LPCDARIRLLCLSESERLPRLAVAPSMKITTFNINGINGRLAVLLRWFEDARPDVVCLQELKAINEKFPRDALETAGYGAVWHGQKSWNGVAILAPGTVPIETRRGLPGDRQDH